MKKITTALLILFVCFSVFSQNRSFSDYAKDSKWFLGLNVGAAWQTTDVKNKTHYGWGFLIGRSFLYKEKSPISLDVRARFLRGFWEGQDTKYSAVSPLDPAYNGTHGAATNYLDSAGGKTIRNFQADVFSASLELAIHANSLRDKTGLDLYLFGGLGINWHQTYGDLYLADTSGTHMYNYSKLTSNTATAIKTFQDGSFDTPLNGSSTNKYNVSIMPSIGIGIGYQVRPRLEIGIEHRTTFTRTDLFDGKNYDGNLNPSKTKDIFHYTSFFIKVNFRKKGTKKPDMDDTLSTPAPYSNNGGNTSSTRPPIVTNVPTTTYPKPSPCTSPLVTITDPRSNYTTLENRFLLTAQVYNVTTRNQILFKQNGLSNTNFSYNSQNQVFEATVVLNPGQNIFELEGINQCGNAKDSRIIVWNQPSIIAPPIVSFQNPSSSPYSTTNTGFPVRAQVLNITASSQAKVTFNGVDFPNFSFDANSHILSANLTLIEGANTLQITATNTAGTDTKLTTIIYRVPFDIPAPIVQIESPNTNPYTITSNSTEILAKILNVDTKSNVTVTLNGVNTSNFNFDKNTKEFEFQAKSLVFGTNVIYIKGTNEVGKDSKTITLIYQRPVVKTPPLVTFVNPSTNPQTSYVSSFNVQALTQNITGKEQLEVRINGNVTSDFTFSSSSQMVSLLTSLSNGATSISVKATNTDGTDEKSTTIIYRLPNLTLPPTVNITSPVGNPATSTQSTIPIVAKIGNIENESGIQVFVNNNPFTNFNYNTSTKQVDFTFNLSDGTNTVHIVVTNTAGQSEASQNILYVDRTQEYPPTITITNPIQSGQIVNQAAFNFMATTTYVTNKNQISAYFNGVLVNPSLVQFSGNQFSFPATLIEGNNLLQLTATNTDGTANQSTIVNYKKPVAPCEKPTLTWLLPTANGTTVDDSVLQVKAQTTNVTDANQLILRLNGSAISGVNFSVASQLLTKNLSLEEGQNVIELTARTSCGVTTISRTITYKKPQAPCDLPIVSAITPSVLDLQVQNNTFSFIASSVNVTSSDQVMVKVNGKTQDFTLYRTSFNIGANVTLDEGENVITIYVSNDCGSSTLTWNVNNVPCEKPIFEATTGLLDNLNVSDANFTLSGSVKNVSNSADIKLKLNGNPVSFVFNSLTGVFSSNLLLIEGSNTINIDATNNCGSISSVINPVFTAPAKEPAPFVQITEPSRTPYTCLADHYEVKALIQNVTAKSGVSVKVNGSPVDFTYVDGNLSFTQSLIAGSNTIVVTAINSSGTDSDTKEITYKPSLIIVPPIVTITTPSNANEIVTASSYQISGTVDNVQTNQIQVLVNGQSFTDFHPVVIESGKISFSFPLTFDNIHKSYTVKVIATNSAGTNEQSRTLTQHMAPNLGGHGTVVIPTHTTEPTHNDNHQTEGGTKHPIVNEGKPTIPTPTNNGGGTRDITPKTNGEIKPNITPLNGGGLRKP